MFICSTALMKWNGASVPRVGCSQRARASAPVSVPVTGSICGWMKATISSASNARCRLAGELEAVDGSVDRTPDRGRRHARGRRCAPTSLGTSRGPRSGRAPGRRCRGSGRRRCRCWRPPAPGCRGSRRAPPSPRASARRWPRHRWNRRKSSINTANSSPPSRARKSPGRSWFFIRRPRAESRSSPAPWPRVSLSSLKSLRSISIRTARFSRPGSPASSSSAAAATRARRFGKPVSSSV